LLLGVIRLICVAGVGVMIIFWKKLDLNLSNTQRVIAGSLFIVYGVLRFTLSFKKEPDE